MSAVPVPPLITLEEFDRRYGGENGWEFWFGEAVRKPVPTWYHGIMQLVLGELLFRAGYFAGAEIDLKIDPTWQPRPDVLAARRMDGRYPTKPVDVVFEILSDDQMAVLLTKCEHYVRIGIKDIYVIDPEGRRIWAWNAEIKDLERWHDIHLNNGQSIGYDDIWNEFDRRLDVTSEGCSN